MRDAVFYRSGGFKPQFTLKLFHNLQSFSKNNVTTTDLQSLSFYTDRGGVKAFLLERTDIGKQIDKYRVFFTNISFTECIKL